MSYTNYDDFFNAQKEQLDPVTTAQDQLDKAHADLAEVEASYAIALLDYDESFTTATDSGILNKDILAQFGFQPVTHHNKKKAQRVYDDSLGIDKESESVEDNNDSEGSENSETDVESE